MRIAIFADVHGNRPALDAVLDDVAALEPDRIVANGDLVNRLPEGVAVLERLEGVDAVRLLGNHDDLMRKWVERDVGLPATWFDDPFWRATGWCAERLAAVGRIEELAAAPLTHRIDVPGAPRVVISHGSPRDYREGYGRHLTERAIREIADETGAGVLVGSHTHRPLHRTWGGVHVYNTGAVGTPFNGDPRAQYLVLTLERGCWSADFRAVPYERGAALAAFHRTGFLEEGGVSAHVFHAELQYARPFLIPFLRWTDETGRERDVPAWQAFRAAFADRFEPVAMPAAG